MIQSALYLLARVFIWLVGVGPVMLELRRAVVVDAARKSIAVAIGTREEIDEGEGSGGGIEARGIGFGEYMMPECECEVDDDGDEKPNACGAMAHGG